MPLRNAREIINKEAVRKRIAAAKTLADLQPNTMPVIAAAYLEGRDVIRRRFVTEPKAGRAIEAACYLIDTILEILFEVAKPHLKQPENIALLAVGGYGRRELFPFSDIDILFLYGKKNKESDAFAQWVLYHLWDLGLAVGHSVRDIKHTLEQADEDTTIRTNLLDARFICGGAKLWQEYDRAFLNYIHSTSAIDFVEAKLKERTARHQRTGDSRYVLEPNLKEGKGGLRDLHTLWWLVKYTYAVTSFADLVTIGMLTEEEYKSFIAARDFLWLVRIHMHLIAARPEERLTFDMQRAVAEAMGYYDDGTARAVERFMKEYFQVVRTVGNLTRSVCAVLEEDKKHKPRRGPNAGDMEKHLGEFILSGARLAVASDDAFEKNPLLLITLFQVAHEHELDIHPRTLQLVTRTLWKIDTSLRHSRAANAAFMEILLSERNPEPALRRMSEAGVLGRFIPDFGRVIGQMQFNMYHVYTVDEHTLFAIGILHGIGAGKFIEEIPVVTDIVQLVKSKRVLFLSLFAHDIAKGKGGDHSVLGEVVIRKLARRFGFDGHEIETCAWLVRNHLIMSHTAFKRDIKDPKTIEDFVARVQSPERLRLLLILTVADIRAVGPGVWNGWKGALLRELYYAAEAKMGASDAINLAQEEKYLRKELTGLLKDWKPTQIEAYLEEGGSSFWSGNDAPTHARIARLLRQAEKSKQPLVMDTSHDTFRAITDIILATPDQHGLFSRISGAMSLCNANILSAKIFTLKGGMAIEMFHIQDENAQAFDKPDKLARLAVYLKMAVDGTLDMDKEIADRRLTYPSRMEVFKVPPRVFVENKVSANYTVIEINGRDRIGFLYSVTHVLAELGLTIATAHISTYGERAVDVFYVKDAFGMKIMHESKINQVRDRIVAALSAASEKAKRAG